MRRSRGHSATNACGWALQEALVDALVHADYSGTRGVRMFRRRRADPVTDPVDRLVQTLLPGPAAPSAIQAALGLKHRATFRATYLPGAMEQVEGILVDNG